MREIQPDRKPKTYNTRDNPPHLIYKIPSDHKTAASPTPDIPTLTRYPHQTQRASSSRYSPEVSPMPCTTSPYPPPPINKPLPQQYVALFDLLVQLRIAAANTAAVGGSIPNSWSAGGMTVSRPPVSRTRNASVRPTRPSSSASASKRWRRSLARKNEALAETAALLALRKKARAIWGDEDE